jgi:hypothetical protein
MAMSKLDVPVYPWLLGQESPQLDFIHDLTTYDPDFKTVTCRYYCDPFVYSLRGIKSTSLRKFLIGYLSLFSGMGDHMNVTPYVVHFGWLREKQPFYRFAERMWAQATARG